VLWGAVGSLPQSIPRIGPADLFALSGATVLLRHANAPDRRGVPSLGVQTPREACATDWPMPFEPMPDPQPLILCPRCKLEMRLLGIEPYNSERELFTFECTECGQLEVRMARGL
jgi:hypothetical protein